MKAAVWKWTKVVLFTPVVIVAVIMMSPLLGAFAAYDVVFFGWGVAQVMSGKDRRNERHARS